MTYLLIILTLTLIALLAGGLSHWRYGLELSAQRRELRRQDGQIISLHAAVYDRDEQLTRLEQELYQARRGLSKLLAQRVGRYFEEPEVACVELDSAAADIGCDYVYRN